jgi:hypothetical protein
VNPEKMNRTQFRQLVYQIETKLAVMMTSVVAVTGALSESGFNRDEIFI